ncbi:MAG: hypothetical protein Q7S43_05265 [bacterium]|nr:hypothetical protein [bacterium]
MEHIFLAQISDNLKNAPGAALDIQVFFNLLSKLSCWFLRFGIIALGVMIIFYGILFLKSKGSASEFSNAKKAFGWGIVGGLVIMGVFTIILTIPSLLGAINGTPISYPILKILSNCS